MKHCYPSIPTESSEYAILSQKAINTMFKTRTQSDRDCRFEWIDKQNDSPTVTTDGFILGVGHWECHTHLTAYPFKSVTLTDILEQISKYDFLKNRTY